jgi:hypothetical protein
LESLTNTTTPCSSSGCSPRCPGGRGPHAAGARVDKDSNGTPLGLAWLCVTPQGQVDVSGVCWMGTAGGPTRGPDDLRPGAVLSCRARVARGFLSPPMRAAPAAHGFVPGSPSPLLFSQNKPATSNQPAVLFSQYKSALAIRHQSNEAGRCKRTGFVYRDVPVTGGVREPGLPLTPRQGCLLQAQCKLDSK